MATALDLSGKPLTLAFKVNATGTPSRTPLDDGRLLFKIDAQGTVTGDIDGTMWSRITELNPVPPIYQGISVTFTIETADGTIEGYYSGSIYHPEGSSIASINAKGQILSASVAYVDLFLADILVTAKVEFVDGHSVGETGTVTILPVGC